MNRIFYCGILCAVLFAACGGAKPAPKVNNQTNAVAVSPTPTPPQTPLEVELTYAQNANFRQIFAFSRKDAGKLTTEDIEYFRQYAPGEQINQRLKTSDNKHIVAGTNFPFQPEQMEALQKRFTVEDMSEKYGRKPDANAPQKTNGK